MSGELSNNIYYQPDSLSQLRKPDETIRYSTRKIVPQSNSTGSSFGNSTINFRWSTSGNAYTMLDRSFLVINSSVWSQSNAGEATASGGANPCAVQPSVQKDVALSYNFGNNLFSGMELKAGAFSLDNVNQNAPQCSVVMKRLQRSGAWADRFGKSVENLDVSFDDRKANIAYNGLKEEGHAYGNSTVAGTGTIAATAAGVITGAGGSLFLTELVPGDRVIMTGGAEAGAELVISTVTSNTAATAGGPTVAINAGAFLIQRPNNLRKTAQANKNQHCFQPNALGIWASGQALPPCQYELIMRPFAAPQYKQCALESNVDGAPLVVPSSGAPKVFNDDMTGFDADFSVDQIYLVLCIAERYERAPERQNVVFDIPVINCQPRQISGAAGVTESFTVSKSTHGLGIALQDKTAGSSTEFSIAKFIAGADHADQNGLTRLQISYDGSTRPSPEADFLITPPPADLSGGADQSIYWSYVNREVNDLSLYDSGGSFTDYEDSKELGPLQFYNWARMGTSVSTSVDVRVTYDAFAGDVKQNLLLFVLSRRVVEMSLENGLIVAFVSQEA